MGTAVQDMDGSAIRLARDAAAARIVGSTTAIMLLLTFSYAAARYVVFGPWGLAQLPIYVLNKAFAWSSLTLLCLAASLGPLARIAPARFGPLLWQRKYFGLLGFALASAHILFSLLVFNYRYYRLMFVHVFELTALAELAMSAGVLAWLVLTLPAALSIPSVRERMSRLWWLRAQAVVPFALLLGLVHVLYGAPGWVRPADWHGGLPPISLLNAIMVAGVLTLRLSVRFRAPRPPRPIA